MPYWYLGGVVGSRKAKRFLVLTILVYVAVSILLSYLFVGSIIDVAGSIFVDLGEGENLVVPIVLAGVLSSILVRGYIRWSINAHRKINVVLDIVVFSILVPLIGVSILFAILFVVGLLTFSPTSQLLPNVGPNSPVFISTGIAVLASVLVAWNLLPGERHNIMKQMYSELDDVNHNLTVVESNLNVSKFTNSLQQLEYAIKDLEEIQNKEPPTKGTSERIAATQSKVDELSELVVNGILSEIRERTQSGNYIEAHKLLTRIEHIDIQNESFSETTDSLREEIDRNISQLVSSEIDSMRELFERAKEAYRDSDYENARNELDNVSEHESAIAEIDEKYIHAEFYELSNQLSSLHSDIIQRERKAKIQSHSEQIADLLDIKQSQVKLNTDKPGLYQELEETLDELYLLKREYPTQSWEQIEKHIQNDIIETDSFSADTIQTYTEIISDSGKILRYIETAGESHPAIHPTEWKEAVDTALKKMSPDSLKPVVSEIEKLKEGLWKREHLYQMSWQEFEHLVGSLYDSLGYTTEVTQSTSDMGVDVWAEKDIVRRAIQVKQFGRGNTVGREPLQKTVSSIAKGDADEAVVITSSQFTKTAIEYADDFGPELELISGERLIEKLSLSDVPPPTSEYVESVSANTSTPEIDKDDTPPDIGTPLTKRDTGWNNESKYPYEKFPDAIEDIKELKRNREHDKAEELLLWCINYAESSAKPGQRGHARSHYRHLAIIYRKDNRYQDEVDILQRYVSFCNSMNIDPRDEIIDRLDKAKQIAEG